MADSIVPTAPATTLSQLLTARVPGLTVLSQDGSVGASPVIAIRGYSGGPTVSRPLLIVDGNPLQDVKALSSVSAVFLKGERVIRSELFEQK